MEKWITTDPDNLQFRKVSTFTFKEFNRKEYPELFKKYVNTSDRDLKPIWDIKKYWIEDTIDLLDYTQEENYESE